MSGKYYHPDHDFIRKLGAAPPTATPHGTDSEISDNLKKLMPNSWRLVGNKLIGQTEMGELTQFLPTNKILVGTDEKGLPIFRDVVIQ